MLGPINVTLELYPIVVQFPNLSQREYLVASRIGKNRTIPSHELMQSSQIMN